MVISLEKKELGDAVSRVSRFAQRTATSLPVLGGIVILAGDDGIKLRATNLETGIDIKITGTIKDAGVVVLPAQVLKETSASFTGAGAVTIEHAGETAVISTSGAKSTLRTLPYEDFPTLPIPEGSKAKFAIAGSILKSLILSVAPCASVSTIRPELASIFIKAEGGVITSAATDSFRLIEKKVTSSGSIPPFTMLIPAKNAVELAQTIPDDEVTVLVDEHQCAVMWKDGVITSRLVTVSYPDYQQIIPKTFVSEATLLRKDFDPALRLTSVFSDSFQKVKLKFDAAGKRVVLDARNADVGTTAESIPAAINGESIELAFNYRYLQAPLSLFTTENISLSASGIGRALVMRGVGDSSLLYLVMPMNQ
ncbi:MAG: DNA polymerase III, beta subunit [Parcubacteria bacterium C7867-001]|nr:MAG: DNA polymerase III, beta subunit [Parcubacteria bacterium C7867-001]